MRLTNAYLENFVARIAGVNIPTNKRVEIALQYIHGIGPAAAKEIKGLIDDSVGKVNDGSALVHKAGATMGEIVASVQRVTDIMAEISAASQEQSAGIEQVNQTVVQMDETTQQNAALVEEASAAARAMEEQAEQLAVAVSRFRLQAGPMATARRAA